MSESKPVVAADWSAEKYNQNASFVYSNEFTSPVLLLLDPKPGEHIIDFGCGSGELTAKLKNAVGSSGIVVGVDFSPNMISMARKNGVGCCFVGDVQNLDLTSDDSGIQEVSSVLPAAFDYKFDAVFTNAALHWCKRSPKGVIESAARALKKGGRFVGEMGGFMNIVGIRTSIYSVLEKRGLDPVARDPWFFPSPEDYRQLLESCGFRVLHISLNPRFTPLVGDIVDWQQTFCRQSYYADLDDSEMDSIMREVQEMCAVDCQDKNGKWALMYVRLRFVAVLDKYDI